MPFDIVDQRAIFYDITDLASVEATVKTLRRYASYAIANSKELVTPLTSFEKFHHIRQDNSDGGATVAGVLEEVVTRLSRLEQQLTRGESSQNSREWESSPVRVRPVSAVIDDLAQLVFRIEELEALDSLSNSDRHRVNQLKAEASDLVKEFPPSRAVDIMRQARKRASVLAAADVLL